VRSRLSGHGLRSGLLRITGEYGIRTQTTPTTHKCDGRLRRNRPDTRSAERGQSEHSEPACSWYPLISASGLHLPPGSRIIRRLTPLPTSVDVDAGSTVAVHQRHFEVALDCRRVLAVVQGSSIEELKDTQINQLFNYLYGQDAYTIFGYGTPRRATSITVLVTQIRLVPRRIRQFRLATSTTTPTPPRPADCCLR